MISPEDRIRDASRERGFAFRYLVRAGDRCLISIAFNEATNEDVKGCRNGNSVEEQKESWPLLSERRQSKTT